MTWQIYKLDFLSTQRSFKWRKISFFVSDFVLSRRIISFDPCVSSDWKHPVYKSYQMFIAKMYLIKKLKNKWAIILMSFIHHINHSKDNSSLLIVFLHFHTFMNIIKELKSKWKLRNKSQNKILYFASACRIKYSNYQSYTCELLWIIYHVLFEIYGPFILKVV